MMPDEPKQEHLIRQFPLDVFELFKNNDLVPQIKRNYRIRQILEVLEPSQKFELIGLFIDDVPISTFLLRHFDNLDEEKRDKLIALGDEDVLETLPEDNNWSFLQQLWPEVSCDARSKILQWTSERLNDIENGTRIQEDFFTEIVRHGDFLND